MSLSQTHKHDVLDFQICVDIKWKAFWEKSCVFLLPRRSEAAPRDGAFLWWHDSRCTDVVHDSSCDSVRTVSTWVKKARVSKWNEFLRRAWRSPSCMVKGGVLSVRRMAKQMRSAWLSANFIVHSIRFSFSFLFVKLWRFYWLNWIFLAFLEWMFSPWIIGSKTNMELSPPSKKIKIKKGPFDAGIT